jgi:hypothetical protein
VGRFNDPLHPSNDQWRPKIEQRLRALEHQTASIHVYPRPLAAASTDWFVPTTSGSFVSLWEGIIERWSGSGFYASVPYRLAAGTTGELRIERAGAVTLARAISASSGTAVFRWLHGGTAWAADVVRVQGRRTAGSGNVEVGFPTMAIVDSRGATGAGI